MVSILLQGVAGELTATLAPAFADDAAEAANAAVSATDDLGVAVLPVIRFQYPPA